MGSAPSTPFQDARALIAAELSAMTDAELRAAADRVRGTSKRGVRRKMTEAEVVLLAAIISEQSRRADGVQSDVENFHRALDIPVHTTPAIRRPELRAALIEEEAQETVDAIRAGDIIEAIDGLCDLLCVVYGAAAEFGVNLAPFWAEVHRTNMAKAGGPVREDGKRLKPDGWTPPDIAGVLARQLADADSSEVSS